MTTAFILMMGAAGCFCISAFFGMCLAYRQGRRELWDAIILQSDVSD